MFLASQIYLIILSHLDRRISEYIYSIGPRTS